MASDPELTSEAAAAALAACACFNFRRASRAVTRLFDDVLQPSGLRSTQFVILVAIQARPKATVQSFSRELGLERSALTRRLGPLTRAGLVKLTTHRAGGPATAELTAKGRKLTAETAALWQEAQGRFVAQFGAERWSLVHAALGDVSSAAGDA